MGRGGQKTDNAERSAATPSGPRAVEHGVSDNEIAVHGLVKQFRNVRAVDDLSFTVRPGRVTGFLGPNGAGKTTTLRMILGLVSPTAGTATIGGRRYADLDEPLEAVGAVLEASSFHRGRTGRNHLLVLCDAAGLPASRADEVLDVVGLTAAARRKVRGYSLGMKQRLGIAAALLGDPRTLILDEPANGLDPEGVHWMRGLLRGLADQGRTVLVSSHLLAEVQHLADDVVIIAAGKLVRQATVAELTGELSTAKVRVRTPEPDKLTAALNGAGVERGEEDVLRLTGIDTASVFRAAVAAGVELHELTYEWPDLERVFLELTSGRSEIQ
jgi:ABC-2 type transport system ATP-binding protein